MVPDAAPLVGTPPPNCAGTEGGTLALGLGLLLATPATAETPVGVEVMPAPMPADPAVGDEEGGGPPV